MRSLKQFLKDMLAHWRFGAQVMADSRWLVDRAGSDNEDLTEEEKRYAATMARRYQEWRNQN